MEFFSRGWGSRRIREWGAGVFCLGCDVERRRKLLVGIRIPLKSAGNRYCRAGIAVADRHRNWLLSRWRCTVNCFIPPNFMNLQDCIEFTKKNPVCFLATADGDQPRVRAFLFWFADETGFYFQTLAPKDVFLQIKANPKIEVCFFNNGDLMTARMLRVTGVAEFREDPALRDKLFHDMPFLAAVGNGQKDPIFQMFRISKGEAVFWTMRDILREHTIERLRF